MRSEKNNKQELPDENDEVDTYAVLDGLRDVEKIEPTEFPAAILILEVLDSQKANQFCNEILSRYGR